MCDSPPSSRLVSLRSVQFLLFFPGIFQRVSIARCTYHLLCFFFLRGWPCHYLTRICLCMGLSNPSPPHPPSSNLVDGIWPDQPPVPCQPVRVHPVKYAGVAVPDKLVAVRKLIVDARACSLVVMAMDEVSKKMDTEHTHACLKLREWLLISFCFVHETS